MSALRVTPEALVDAGGQTGSAASSATPPAANVTPAAPDTVSVGVSNGLNARIAAIAAQIQATTGQTQHAATRLTANAADYTTQEQANASGLGFAASPAAAGVSTLPSPPPLPAPQVPAPQAGTTPTTGKQIAELIHSGPGPQPLHQAADRLRSHAEQLATTSTELRSAAANLQTGWFSGAGEAAQHRIADLADAYDQQGQAVLATAGAADSQAANVARARTAIPRPEQFDDVEQRLAAALRANAMPGSAGLYAPVIAQLQGQLAELNTKAAAGYADYTTDAQVETGIQALDWRTGPPFPQEPPKNPDDGNNEDKNTDKTKDGHGGSVSKGKGSDTHIAPNGEVEQTWGTPTDPHEVAGGSGTFDNGNGNWEWHGPGYEGSAQAEHHSDGYSGEAKAGAWIAKGDVGWSGDVFGHPTSVSANAGAGAHTGANGAITDHGIGANLDAFVGVEAGAGAHTSLGPVDLSLDASALYGAGGNAGFDFGMQDGKFVIGGNLGAAWGPGAKIAPHIAIDPDALTDGFKKVTDWVDGLFG